MFNLFDLGLNLSFFLHNPSLQEGDLILHGARSLAKDLLETVPFALDHINP